MGRAHRNNLRLPAAGLLEGKLHIISRRHAHHREAIGKTLDNAERAPADGAGRTEDGDAPHEGWKSGPLGPRSSYPLSFVIPTEGFSPSGGICCSWRRDSYRTPCGSFVIIIPSEAKTVLAYQDSARGEVIGISGDVEEPARRYSEQ